ncbi:MAG: hypothetical protein J2P26_15110, partial [Nocardiopsaceae bacterium]|nr:hypothetical protein [Nocardiopsaceae bacterium]
MSVVVTGNPARGGPLARAVPARWRSRLTRGTTPGRLRLALIGLVAASLAWGALAGFTVSEYSSAATGVVTTSEPLTLDAQQIYHDLSDANDAEATAFLVGGLQPRKLVNRYNADVKAASAAIERATALGGGSPDLATLSADLPAYADEIGTARAVARLGYPLGAAYLREASNQMNASLLPAAQRLYNADNAKLTATSAEGTGLPLMLVTIVAGLALGYALYRTSRWLTRRTNRVLNPGLVAAGLAGLISLVWLAVAFGGAYFDLQSARTGGSVPVQALAQADIVALQAHADESLTLIDNSGDDQYQTDFLARRRSLGPGSGTLLDAAVSASAGTPAAGAVSAAAGHAAAWNQAHAKLRRADDSGDHATAVKSALGVLGPDDAGREFAGFSADMMTAINDGQAAFAASASAGGNM